jgi:nucleotide-binding universal stress UspA family protein
MHDALSQQIVRECPAPLVIVRRPDHYGTPSATRHLLVPIDGSLFSRYAAEFAFAYARADEGHVTVLHIIDESRSMSGSLPMPDRRNARFVTPQRAAAVEALLREEIHVAADLYDMPFSVRILASGAPAETIIEESASGFFDVLVLGAENKMLAQPLLFGQGIADIVERAGCTTAVVVPHLD